MYCDSKKHFCYNIYTYIVFVNMYTKAVLEEHIYIYIYIYICMYVCVCVYIYIYMSMLNIKKLYVRHTDKKMFIQNFVYVCFCTNI